MPDYCHKGISTGREGEVIFSNCLFPMQTPPHIAPRTNSGDPLTPRVKISKRTIGKGKWEGSVPLAELHSHNLDYFLKPCSSSKALQAALKALPTKEVA